MDINEAMEEELRKHRFNLASEISYDLNNGPPIKKADCPLCDRKDIELYIYKEQDEACIKCIRKIMKTQ